MTVSEDMLELLWDTCDGVKSDCQKDEPCLVDAHFERQKELPLERRTNHFMISCPCRKCNPHHL